MTEGEEFRATFPIVFNYTVPIKENAASRDDQMGAGVLIDVDGKLLVATAAHCIEDSPLVLETDFFLPVDRSRIKILRQGTHRTLDIGFMELERDKGIPILNKGVCSLEMISLEPLSVDGMVHVVGFPAVARTFEKGNLTVVKKGFGTLFKRAEADHFYFTYPELGFTWDDAKNDWARAPFDKHPKGYSGGGVWAFTQAKPGELFTPQRYIRLYAIQSAWNEAERYVKCVPIVHWLTLIGSRCPDLRPAIASRFRDVVSQC